MSKSRQLQEVFAFIDLCLTSINEERPSEVARRTGLCTSTIYRLAQHKFSLAVHHGTLLALGNAAGLHLVWHKSRARIRLAS